MKSMSSPLLELQDINLSYSEFNVLKHVNFVINKSEITAIVGEHGAGKTSLCNLISGIERPNSGQFIFDNMSMPYFSHETAIEYGIEIITQNNPMLDDFTVAENIFAHVKNKKSKISRSLKIMANQTSLIFEKYGFDIDPLVKIRNLKLSDRVLVDIIKYINTEPRLLILDEALQKLSYVNFNKTTQLLKKLSKTGTAIIYVTHRIDDIYSFADKVSIIRNGEVIITEDVAKIDKLNLVKLAYTQINSEDRINSENESFYQLLKYNKAILEKLPVILVAVDCNNKVKIINQSAKDFFCINTIFIEHSVRKLFNNNLAVYETIESSLLDSIEKRFYNIPFNTENHELQINIITHPIYDESFLIGTIIIIEDVTVREELRQKVLLSEKLASTGLLAAGVAHEINNPLTAVYNYIEYLDHKVESPDLVKIIRNLKDEVQTIAYVTKNLMTFSDSQQNRHEKVEINSLFEETINLLNFNAQYKNISIIFSKHTEDILLQIDPIEFKQIVLNLLKNSFESIVDGGIIHISTSIEIHEYLPQAKIVISDNGPGISLKNRFKIFTPFFSTKGNNGSNMGLGLNIVHNLVIQNSGVIDYSANVPQGCVFTMLFPIT